MRPDYRPEKVCDSTRCREIARHHQVGVGRIQVKLTAVLGDGPHVRTIGRARLPDHELMCVAGPGRMRSRRVHGVLLGGKGSGRYFDWYRHDGLDVMCSASEVKARSSQRRGSNRVGRAHFPQSVVDR